MSKITYKEQMKNRKLFDVIEQEEEENE